MATATQATSRKAKPLQLVTAEGWRGGLGNLLRKELGQWWGTKMWWIQLIIWVLLLNGVTTILMIEGSRSGESTAAELSQQVVQTFLQMGATSIGIGIVITMQGAIVGEKQLGTAAWVLSKPASRPAFILSKAFAYMLGFGVTAILIPTILFIAQTRWLVPVEFSMGPFLAGVGLVALIALFYLMLALMLGTVFASRGPIMGIGIAIALGGVFFKSLLPPALLAFTPWLLGDISAAVALGMPLPEDWIVHVATTIGWIILFIVMALWRFSREEF